MKSSKIYFFVIVLTYLGLVPNSTSAQTNCPESLLFETYDFGDNQNTFFVALKFKITSDSVYIIDALKNAGRYDYTGFKILKKECRWSSDMTEGENLYDLELTDIGTKRYPTLSISYKEKKGLIKLVYLKEDPIKFTVIKL
jgi:hypothetical protein